MEKDIRKSVIAGTWYPGNPATLSGDIRKYFEKVPCRPSGARRGPRQPPCRLRVLGADRRSRYRLIEGQRYDAVVVIGPSHRVLFHGASVWPSGDMKHRLASSPCMANWRERSSGRPRPEFRAQAPRGRTLRRDPATLPAGALGAFCLVPIVMGPRTCRPARPLPTPSTGPQEARASSSWEVPICPISTPTKRPGASTRGHRPRAETGLPGSFARARGRLLRGLRRGPRCDGHALCRKAGARGVKVLQVRKFGRRDGGPAAGGGYLSAAFFQGRRR